MSERTQTTLTIACIIVLFMLGVYFNIVALIVTAVIFLFGAVIDLTWRDERDEQIRSGTQEQADRKSASS